MSDQSKPTVVVTGFGLFRGYKENASWEAVKMIEMEDVNLIKLQIKVSYNEVDEIVPKLWKDYNPSLVVHCGVSCQASCLVLETKGHSSEYNHCDVDNCLPLSKSEEPCKCLSSGLPIPEICEKINESFSNQIIQVPAAISTNAGRYLCEYTFYKSLEQNLDRTIFIHVPELNNPYSCKELSDALKCAIQICLKSLNK